MNAAKADNGGNKITQSDVERGATIDDDTDMVVYVVDPTHKSDAVD